MIDKSRYIITLEDWEKAGLSFYMYENDKRRGFLKTTGRAAYGRPVEILWDSIKEDRKEAIRKAGLDPESKRILDFGKYVEHDAEALAYFSNYRTVVGKTLDPEVAKEHYANACVLNAVLKMYNLRIGLRSSQGGRKTGVWDTITREVNEMEREEWPHTLPAHPRRLKEKLERYKEDKYDSLLHKGVGNQNGRKVTAKLERLILSLYCLDTKPYVTYVHELYHQFLGGVIEIVDVETGAFFEREDFINDHGKAIEISDSTIWNYVNKPGNSRIVAQYRSSKLEYDSVYRPHAHRHSPMYAGSKVSLDDRDLPRKMPDGKRAKAYYAYDVASGCVIGAAYSRLKDMNLFVDCFRDMFRFIDAHGLKSPAEIEVEHHLANNMKDTLLKAGWVFRFVRFCAPGNSKEKRAEHFNGRKKLGTEKKFQAGIGRPFAKSEAHRLIQEKVFDENNDTYKTKTYSFDELVADDRRANEIYNNSPHPNQKLYKGMTRLDVFLMHQNPNLVELDRALLLRYIGEETITSIRRNQYVRVQYDNFQLSDPGVVNLLEPNNLEVKAYWLHDSDKNIKEVYLWQGDNYIDCCQKIERFQ
ncbi:MAG: hypothetical protein GX587_06440, partial [Bacteroidales bacterium]|nr:hypothetical protein [Bacteroidales bacterium]